MWFLSPSGWPTAAIDGSLFAVRLAANGWDVLNESQVQAAIDAYNAGTAPPPAADYVTEEELAEALAGIGAGSGAVDSVNGQTGVVVLDADDIGDGTAKVLMSSAERTKLATAVQGNDVRVTADQAAGTASIRTLGTAPEQAASGAHTHGDPFVYPQRHWDPATSTWSSRPLVPAGVVVTAYSSLYPAATPPPGASPQDVWMLAKTSAYWPA